MASTYFDASLPPRNHLLRLNISESSQDIANNRTLISWSLEIYRAGNYKPYGSDGAWSTSIDGNGYSGSFSYNFNNYTYLLLASGSTWVYHTADGTKTAYFSGYGSIGSAGGSNTAGGYFTLTTIPRATTPTVSPVSGNTADTFTISHVPATSTFYHDVAYSLDGGATYTDIQTNIVGTDTSTDWTPAHSLLPNDASKTAVIRLITRSSSGGTIIGTKTVNLPLTVPASVKPTVSSVSFVDDQTSSPDIPTMMGGSGRFVQGWSKLKPTITSAGAGGSTVTASQVTINGQVAASGVAFGLPVALSGAVPFSAIATDSRSRTSDPLIGSVTVKAYNFPNLPTPLVERTSDASGLVPSPTGTYLAITPAASVSDLTFSGSQKNDLEYKIRVKTGAGSYTTVQDWVSASGITWTSKYIISGKSASSEHTVEISIRDVFGKNGYDTANTVKTLTILVPSETVVMDLDGNDGIGIGGYRRASYRLDVHGDAYADNFSQSGLPVVDFGDAATTSLPGIVELATDAETLTGTDTGRAVTPASLAARLSGFAGRNKIRNARCRVNQRGVTSGVALTPRQVGFDGWACAGITNLFVNPSAETNTTGWTGTSATLTRDNAWAASRSWSFKLVPTGNDSHMNISMTTVVGRRYTVSGTCHLTGALTGSEIVAGRARSIFVYDPGAGTPTLATATQAPNVAGDTRVSVSFVAISTTTVIRFYHGQTGGSIWWDDLMLTEGSVLWPYIDGTKSDCAWTGTTDASTSVRGPSGATLTWTDAPQGQTVTIASGGGLMQIIERADIEAGTYMLSWVGTATARVYNVGTAPAALPSFASGPFQVTLDGLDDVVVEFRAVGGSKTLWKPQLEAGSLATAFEEVSLHDTLLRCLRYYYRQTAVLAGQRLAAGWQTLTTQSEVGIDLPVPMRAIPGFTISGCQWTDATSFNSTITAAQQATHQQAFAGNFLAVNVYYGAAGATYRPGFIAGVSPGAYIAVDAELV